MSPLTGPWPPHDPMTSAAWTPGDPCNRNPLAIKQHPILLLTLSQENSQDGLFYQGHAAALYLQAFLMCLYDWLREPRDPPCNIQLQTSFLKCKYTDNDAISLWMCNVKQQIHVVSSFSYEGAWTFSTRMEKTFSTILNFSECLLKLETPYEDMSNFVNTGNL